MKRNRGEPRLAVSTGSRKGGSCKWQPRNTEYKSAAISFARPTRIERVSTLVEVLKDTWFEQRIKIHAQDDTHTSFPI